MNKPYARILKENCLPYLTGYENIKGMKHKLKYVFDITNATDEDREYFWKLVGKFKCWKYRGNSNNISYNTDSVTLKHMFEANMPINALRSMTNRHEPIETVEDIPSHVLDIYKAEYNKEYKCNFNEKGKGKEMNKFNVSYNITINVNGKQINLKDPINPNDALNTVLELNNRLKVLSDQLDNLNEINVVAETSTDTIDVSKITEVVINEIDEIKELIDYINSNIDED